MGLVRAVFGLATGMALALFFLDIHQSAVERGNADASGWWRWMLIPLLLAAGGRIAGVELAAWLNAHTTAPLAIFYAIIGALGAFLLLWPGPGYWTLVAVAIAGVMRRLWLRVVLPRLRG